MKITNKVSARFFNKVQKSSGCWTWTGTVRPSGYGVICIDRWIVSAHRLSYMIHYGGTTPGLVVMHLCHNRKCVNPAHLKEGTHKENIRMSSVDGRMATGSRNALSRSNPLSKERWNKISKKRKGKKLLQFTQPWQRVIDQYGIIYPSQAIAAKALGLPQQNINKVVLGDRKSVGGFVFKRYSKNENH